MRAGNVVLDVNADSAPFRVSIERYVMGWGVHLIMTAGLDSSRDFASCENIGNEDSLKLKIIYYMSHQKIEIGRIFEINSKSLFS